MKYVHTNIVARDWRQLAQFYVEVFGCEPIGPVRNLSGEWLEQATGVDGAHLRGQHLLLPGHGSAGPTLEIFSYDEMPDGSIAVANRLGLGHLAFAVDDVAATLRNVIAHGGSHLGSIVKSTVPGAGEIELTYARDPEGNIIELQR